MRNWLLPSLSVVGYNIKRTIKYKNSILLQEALGPYYIH